MACKSFSQKSILAAWRCSCRLCSLLLDVCVPTRFQLSFNFFSHTFQQLCASHKPHTLPPTRPTIRCPSIAQPNAWHLWVRRQRASALKYCLYLACRKIGRFRFVTLLPCMKNFGRFKQNRVVGRFLWSTDLTAQCASLYQTEFCNL